MIILTEAGHKIYSFNNSLEFKEFINTNNLKVIGFYDNKITYSHGRSSLVLVGQNRLMVLRKTEEPYITKL